MPLANTSHIYIIPTRIHRASFGFFVVVVGGFYENITLFVRWRARGHIKSCHMCIEMLSRILFFY